MADKLSEQCTNKYSCEGLVGVNYIIYVHNI